VSRRTGDGTTCAAVSSASDHRRRP
jgi:hypothetical protein